MSAEGGGWLFFVVVVFFGVVGTDERFGVVAVYVSVDLVAFRRGVVAPGLGGFVFGAVDVFGGVVGLVGDVAQGVGFAVGYYGSVGRVISGVYVSDDGRVVFGVTGDVPDGAFAALRAGPGEFGRVVLDVDDGGAA